MPPHASHPVIAVKFIHKEHAFRTGRLRPKQLLIEISLHRHVSGHENVIRYLSHGTEDPAWVWVAMELAEGGDLFDKIEADVGVGEDVGHFYFAQLVGAIGWCHGKGVAHRDVKPENVLVSGSGDLKLADVGLATKFLEKEEGSGGASGARKSCAMVCGSPPYIAPEILAVGKENASAKRKASGEAGGGGVEGKKVGYDPEIADVWSVAIVLFVLLAGNTPWDSPVMGESYEFHEYVTSGGNPTDELWQKIPPAAMSLVRGMLNVDTKARMTLEDVRRHPWFLRKNPHLNAKGKAANPVGLATQLLEGLHIDFTADAPPPSQSQPQQHSQNAMDIDSQPHPRPTPSQPQAPPPPNLDWEPSQSQAPAGFQSTQQARDFLLSIAEDPAMSQFMATPSVPLTLTQQARQFKDILPSASLAKFYSQLPLARLLAQLEAAFHRLEILLPVPEARDAEHAVQSQGSLSLWLNALDARSQPLQGNLVIARLVDERRGEEVLEVRFLKAKGDPLGWRRMFKRVVVLCREGLVRPPS